MTQSEEKLDIVIGSMIILMVGAIILCSAVIPVVSDQVASLSDLIPSGEDAGDQVLNIASYQTLIGVAILMCIIGLVIGIIKMYTGKSSR